MSGVEWGPGLRVATRVPASSANLGPGFDSIGLALGLWDSCRATVTRGSGLVIDVAGEGSETVPRDERHLVYRTMLSAFAALSVVPPPGLHLECHNAVPHGRGLGSSATAIVTGIVAAQALVRAAVGDPAALDLDLTNTLAARLEGHPDNSSASVFGGATLSWSDDDYESTTTVRLTLHPDVVPVVFVPPAQLSTATARAVLPSGVRLPEAAANTARGALLVHALAQDPTHLLPATREWLHQEPRRGSYPASMALVDALRAAGHAAVISGAGPSVLVLSTRQRAESVAAGAAAPWRALRPGVPPTGATVETG